jgi:hypothetical protein
MVRPCSCRAGDESRKGSKDKKHAMSQNLNCAVAVIGIDIGKNSFHVVGLNDRGAIVLRQKWSQGSNRGTGIQHAAVPNCSRAAEARLSGPDRES